MIYLKIEFDYNEFGKPILPYNFQFNISSSNDIIALIVEFPSSSSYHHHHHHHHYLVIELMTQLVLIYHILFKIVYQIQNILNNLNRFLMMFMNYHKLIIILNLIILDIKRIIYKIDW